MLENEREKYEAFFKNFGLQLKYGVYNEYGQHKEMLQDLLLFTSSHEDKAGDFGRICRPDERGPEGRVLRLRRERGQNQEACPRPRWCWTRDMSCFI